MPKKQQIMHIARSVLTLLGFLITISLLILFISPPVQATPTDIYCTPVQVVVFTTAPRFHIRCAQPVGGIIYFAQSTSGSNTALAARVLSILTTAQVAGRTLVIRYDPADLSGATIGCQTNDCRLIQAVGFGQ